MKSKLSCSSDLESHHRTGNNGFIELVRYEFYLRQLLVTIFLVSSDSSDFNELRCSGIREVEEWVVIREHVRRQLHYFLPSLLFRVDSLHSFHLFVVNQKCELSIQPCLVQISCPFQECHLIWSFRKCSWQKTRSDSVPMRHFGPFHSDVRVYRHHFLHPDMIKQSESAHEERLRDSYFELLWLESLEKLRTVKNIWNALCLSRAENAVFLLSHV